MQKCVTTEFCTYRRNNSGHEHSKFGCKYRGWYSRERAVLGLMMKHYSNLYILTPKMWDFGKRLQIKELCGKNRRFANKKLKTREEETIGARAGLRGWKKEFSKELAEEVRDLAARPERMRGVPQAWRLTIVTVLMPDLSTSLSVSCRTTTEFYFFFFFFFFFFCSSFLAIAKMILQVLVGLKFSSWTFSVGHSCVEWTCN